MGLVEKLSAKGVEFISLKEHIDTTTPTGRFTLTVFAAIAELERECTLLRQAEGIAAAKSQGKHMGRPLKKLPENFAEVVKAWERGSITFEEANRELTSKILVLWKAHNHGDLFKIKAKTRCIKEPTRKPFDHLRGFLFMYLHEEYKNVVCKKCCFYYFPKTLSTLFRCCLCQKNIFRTNSTYFRL